MFHRVDDIRALDGPAFFKLAHRLPAYRGVMREAALAAAEDDAPVAQPQAAAPVAQSGGGRKIVPATRAALQAEPGFAGIFSFGVGGGG